MSASALCEASEVWKRLTAPYLPHEDDSPMYTSEELLAKIKPTAGSPRPVRPVAAEAEAGVLGKLLAHPESEQPPMPAPVYASAAHAHRGDSSDVAKHDGPLGGKGVAGMPGGMGHPPTGQYSEKSWLAKAEERRSKFQQAKDKGFSYNKGVMLDVQICRGPQEGTIGFAAGRGHPAIPC